MTSTIRDANVHSDAWNTIYFKLLGISNPGSSSKWIYSAFPERAIDDKNSYPIIVITPIDVTYDPLTFITIKKGPLRATIDIYSTSATQLDSLSDSVADTFETNEDNLFVSGVALMKLVGNSYGQFSRNSLRVHNKTLIYEFEKVWT